MQFWSWILLLTVWNRILLIGEVRGNATLLLRRNAPTGDLALLHTQFIGVNLSVARHKDLPAPRIFLSLNSVAAKQTYPSLFAIHILPPVQVYIARPKGVSKSCVLLSMISILNIPMDINTSFPSFSDIFYEPTINSYRPLIIIWNRRFKNKAYQ